MVDLYAIGLDPVFSDRDGPDWVDDGVPDEVLAHWQVKQSLMAGGRNPGLKAVMTVLFDEYALRYPGIKRVEHEYFHAVHGADDAARRAYLERAHRLGREF